MMLRGDGPVSGVPLGGERDPTTSLVPAASAGQMPSRGRAPASLSAFQGPAQPPGRSQPTPWLAEPSGDPDGRELGEPGRPSGSGSEPCQQRKDPSRERSLCPYRERAPHPLQGRRPSWGSGCSLKAVPHEGGGIGTTWKPVQDLVTSEPTGDPAGGHSCGQTHPGHGHPPASRLQSRARLPFHRERHRPRKVQGLARGPRERKLESGRTWAQDS